MHAYKVGYEMFYFMPVLTITILFEFLWSPVFIIFYTYASIFFVFFTQTGSLIGYLGPVLGSLYDEFSYALYRYTHNVIASGLLSETLQNTLLAQLGVSPWTPDGDWPLQVLPRTLTVLAQVSYKA